MEREVVRARAGDREALDFILRAVERDVSRLALRFLAHPQDAEDAAQEILIRIAGGLGGFRGESGFRTWVYRVACNTLVTLRRRSRMERQRLTFAAFGEDLEQGLAEPPAAEIDPAEALLLEEVKVGCTLAMLQCLDRRHRAAYILGEIVELDHREAAAALRITPSAYRKRLSRARARITGFMVARCGLVNPANACRCRRRVGRAVDLGRVDPARLLFASSPDDARRFPAVLSKIRQLEESRRAAALYRSHPEPRESASFAAWLEALIAGEGPPAALPPT